MGDEERNDERRRQRRSSRSEASSGGTRERRSSTSSRSSRDLARSSSGRKKRDGENSRSKANTRDKDERGTTRSSRSGSSSKDLTRSKSGRRKKSKNGSSSGNSSKGERDGEVNKKETLHTRSVTGSANFFSLSQTVHDLYKHALWNGLNAKYGRSFFELASGLSLHPAVPEEEPLGSKVAGDKIIKVRVHGLELLETDAWTRHPIVRVSIVNSSSGKYFTKHKKRACIVNQSEGASKACFQPMVGSSGMFECKRESTFCDAIPPQMTEPAAVGGSKTDEQGLSWAHQSPLYFNVPASHLMHPNAVMFFEVLDFGPSIDVSVAGGARDGFYPIAWGFLKLVNAAGVANFSLGDQGSQEDRAIRLQLFKYPEDTHSVRCIREVLQEESGRGASPGVFTAFRLANRRRYPSSLKVEVSAAQAPATQTLKPGTRPQNVFQAEANEMEQDAFVDSLVAGNLAEQLASGAGGDSQRTALASVRRHRMKTEPCLIPNQLLCRLPAGSSGSFEAQFSPRGQYLAAVCCEQKTFSIKIFHVASMKLSFVLNGHKSLVYQLSWQKAGIEAGGPLRLASASADGTVRIWRIPDMDAQSEARQKRSGDMHQGRENDEAEPLLENDARKKKSSAKASSAASSSVSISGARCEHVLRHAPPMYIYTCQFHPTAADPPILATGGYDGFIRLWNADTGALLGGRGDGKLDYGRAQHKTHVNSLCFTNDGNRLISGDASGVIIVWRLETGRATSVADAWHVARKVEDPDIMGKSIITVQVHPVERMLLVAAQQNTIRLFELRRYTRVHQGFIGAPVSRSFVRATFSPDGQYVISGSESGKPCVWNTKTAVPAGSKWEFGFPKPLCSIAWHPDQHLVAFSCFGGSCPILMYESLRDTRDVDAAPITLDANLDDDDEDNVPLKGTNGEGEQKAQDITNEEKPDPKLASERTRRLANSLSTLGDSDEDVAADKKAAKAEIQTKVKGIDSLRNKLSRGDLDDEDDDKSDSSSGSDL